MSTLFFVFTFVFSAVAIRYTKNKNILLPLSFLFLVSTLYDLISSKQNISDLSWFITPIIGILILSVIFYFWGLLLLKSEGGIFKTLLIFLSGPILIMVVGVFIV